MLPADELNAIGGSIQPTGSLHSQELQSDQLYSNTPFTNASPEILLVGGSQSQIRGYYGELEQYFQHFLHPYQQSLNDSGHLPLHASSNRSCTPVPGVIPSPGPFDLHAALDRGLSSLPTPGNASHPPVFDFSQVFPTPYDTANGFSRIRTASLERPTTASCRGMLQPGMKDTTVKGCHYPVLLPLLPYTNSIIPDSVACDVLNLYFTEPFSSLFQYASPYVLNRIFRKKSMICSANPRKPSPALAAMLWVSTQTSDAQVLKSSPMAKEKILDGLYTVCLTLLVPLACERKN